MNAPNAAPRPLARDTVTTEGGRLSYLHTGPADGPLVVLVHGWPATAITWAPQIDALATAGFRVLAPDTRGYGRSMVPTEPSAYALRHLVDDLRTLLESTSRTSATWIGHDWGASIVWALAAHHPELCDGVAALAVPYRTLDRGLAAMLDLVDRETYPADILPNAQFDYMAFYETSAEQVTAQFDADPARMVSALYRPGNPAVLSGPSPRAYVSRDGGWFGGPDAMPDLPRDPAMLTDEIYDDLVETLSANGFWGPNCYYLNHADNRRYSDESVHGGRLEMPVLFVEARYDSAADITRSRMAEPMRQHCTDLTEVSLAAGHWVNLEKAAEVNTALLSWLGDHVIPQ
ncbi:alpha/beta hydrolase [Streptomyces chiangmaiensis]|uniref:Alpha/beta hydrolase n=1 Tax=Streptomyces chiangmaiensis TaxID=766497 RepID=A0ABU7FW91_9ACTN|nr:alpha/beta hydrolase [Streptomyces chiangmaiensis]MED7828157.1 alpha/beta hydrolase [Streptomyces chiangmaiensis]